MFHLEYISLKRPSNIYKESFLDWLSEAHSESTYEFWNFNNVKKDFNSFVHSQLEKEIICPIGNIPESVYWIIYKDTMVGRISIRHQLTEKLKEKGGHIGYQISKPYRGNGFATRALKLALTEAKKLEINDVLLTTDRKNLASQAVILKNSGHLISDLNNLKTNELIKYKISLHP